MRASDVVHRIKDRLKHPPLLYKRSGGISVVVTRADGRVEKIGTVSDSYTRRWKVKTDGNSPL